MAATAKSGGKNKKFGRHARNPSSKNQAKRTERNKLKRKATGIPCTYPPIKKPIPKEHVIFSGEVRRARGDFIAMHDTRIIEIGTYTDCLDARKMSTDSPGVHIYRRQISNLIPV
jgi:hypothetical protein